MTAPRRKILCLGVSYTDYAAQLSFQGVAPATPTTQPSVDDVADAVAHKRLTEIDGRDLARCVATEKVCNVDVYTVSQENGATYSNERHTKANFNRQAFIKQIQNKFHQIILDYYWIPTCWVSQHWNRTFFSKTLNGFSSLLEGPDARIYLPFCLHCFKEVLVCQDKLLQHYDIGFLRKPNLDDVSLWKGTNSIDPALMQERFGKRIDQEEIYCTFGPQHLKQSMEDPAITKSALLKFARRLDDFPTIRFIVLQPKQARKGRFLGLTKHPPPKQTDQQTLHSRAPPCKRPVAVVTPLCDEPSRQTNRKRLTREKFYEDTLASGDMPDNWLHKRNKKPPPTR